MVIKDKPHGFDEKAIFAKRNKALAALAKRYPTMTMDERLTYICGLGSGRVLALLAFEKKEKAEKKAKPAKKAKVRK